MGGRNIDGENGKSKEKKIMRKVTNDCYFLMTMHRCMNKYSILALCILFQGENASSRYHHYLNKADKERRSETFHKLLIEKQLQKVKDREVLRFVKIL